MGLISWIKSMFATENDKYIDTSFKDIPIFKTETPEKIVETRIKPVKIPTILDLGEKLSSIFNNLSLLKEEIVTKSWFSSQYEDSSYEILNSLDDVNKRLHDIQNLLINTNNLSKNLSDVLTKFQSPLYHKKLSPSEMIIYVLKNNKRLRYKDIVHILPFSDPTISNHIKILLKNNKINRSRVGKAVYYELV